MQCDDLLGKLRGAFRVVLLDNIENGDPAEVGLSDYEYAHNFERVEYVIDSAIDEVGKEKILECGMGVDDARDVLEGYWRTLLDKGVFEDFEDEVEQL